MRIYEFRMKIVVTRSICRVYISRLWFECEYFIQTITPLCISLPQNIQSELAHYKITPYRCAVCERNHDESSNL